MTVIKKREDNKCCPRCVAKRTRYTVDRNVSTAILESSMEFPEKS
jgi:hypothetical protein